MLLTRFMCSRLYARTTCPTKERENLTKPLGGCIFANYDTAETFWIPSTYVACRVFWTAVFFVSSTRKISVSPPIVSIAIDRRITTFWVVQKSDVDKCSWRAIHSQNWWIQPEDRVKNFAADGNGIHRDRNSSRIVVHGRSVKLYVIRTSKETTVRG